MLSFNSFKMLFMSAPFLSALLIYSLWFTPRPAGAGGTTFRRKQNAFEKQHKHLFRAIIKIWSATFINGIDKLRLFFTWSHLDCFI